jgi:enterochelin esterase-like enzyme
MGIWVWPALADSERRYPPCSDKADIICEIPIPIPFDTAVSRLNNQSLVYWSEGETLHLAARRQEDQVQLCCGVQDDMLFLGSDDKGKVWGVSYRFKNLDQAILSFTTQSENPDRFVWRGKYAPKEPSSVSKFSGHFKTIKLNSRFLKSERSITVYTPIGKKPKGGYPVLIIMDGQSVRGYVRYIEALINSGEMKPIIVIGIHNSDKRRQEYLFKSSAPLPEFLAHEAFVTQEVLPLIGQRFDGNTQIDQTAIFGVSNGASFALAYGTRHPDKIGHVVALSAGIDPENIDFNQSQKLKLYLGAGYYEGGFFDRTKHICDNSIKHKIDCHFMPLYAGHDAEAWLISLTTALKAIFPTTLPH